MPISPTPSTAVVVGAKPLVRQAEDYAGVVWSTTDGGATWAEAQVDGVRGFNAVTSQGAGYWAAGDDNAIAHTDDGVHWTRDTVSAPVVLYGIAHDRRRAGLGSRDGDSSDWFSDSNATAGIVLHTHRRRRHLVTGGRPSAHADTLVDVGFSDADHGRIIGSSPAPSTSPATPGPPGRRSVPSGRAGELRGHHARPGRTSLGGRVTNDPNYGESGRGVVWRSEDAGDDLGRDHDDRSTRLPL